MRLRHLAYIFVGTFLLALGYEYGPPEIKFALGAAFGITFLLWVFGYIDVRKLLDFEKKKQEPDGK